MKWFHSTDKIRPWWPSTATVTCTSAGSASRSKAAAAAAAAALGGNPAAAAFLARSLGRLRKRRNLGSLQVLHLKGWSKGHFGVIPLVNHHLGWPTGWGRHNLPSWEFRDFGGWFRYKSSYLVDEMKVSCEILWNMIHPEMEDSPVKMTLQNLNNYHTFRAFIDSPHFILLFTFFRGLQWLQCLIRIRPCCESLNLLSHQAAAFSLISRLGRILWSHRSVGPTEKKDRPTGLNKGLSSIWDISHGSSSNLYTTWKVDGATPMYWFIMAPC